MRKIRIIEHISLDGVIQAPGGRGEGGDDYPHGGWTARRIEVRRGQRRSPRHRVEASICCLAAAPTLDGMTSSYAAWTPDSRSVTFSSNRAGSFDLWTKRADGSTQAALQVHEKRGLYCPRWSPDGKWLVFRTAREQAGAGDILGIRPGIDTVAVPLAATRFTENAPAISPDGRWLAYSSNESGQFDVYVVPFPNTAAAKWAVSTRGGTEPLWSHSGKELFYRDVAGNLVAVEVQTTPTFAPGRSTPLFPAAAYFSFPRGLEYAVAPDDQRFLMIRQVPGGAPDELIVVDNLFEELKAKSRK